MKFQYGKLLSVIIALLTWGMLFGCATSPLVTVTPAEVGEEPDRLYKARPTEGSLWPGSDDTDSLFTDSKATKVGDIVTILISESSSASKKAGTKTSRDSSQDLSMTKLFGLGTSLGISDFLGSGNPFDPNFNYTNKNAFDGKGETTRSDTLTATMTAVVTKILPSGNFHIEGSRIVHVNNEKQTLVLKGIIRPVDIGYQNTISSSLIANAEINYSGRGVISDKQKVGWGTRILDYVWPF